MSSARKLRTLPAELLRCPPRSVAGWVCAAPVEGWPPLELPSSLHWPPPVRLPQTLHGTSPCHGGAVPQPRRAPLEKSPPDRIHPDADLASLSKPQGVASSKADCEYRQDPERTLCRGAPGTPAAFPGPRGMGPHLPTEPVHAPLPGCPGGWPSKARARWPRRARSLQPGHRGLPPTGTSTRQTPRTVQHGKCPSMPNGVS